MFGPPAAEILLQSFPWQTVFLIFAVVILLTLLALPILKPAAKTHAHAEPHENVEPAELLFREPNGGDPFLFARHVVLQRK